MSEEIQEPIQEEQDLNLADPALTTSEEPVDETLQKAVEYGYQTDKEAFEKANPGKKYLDPDEFIWRGETLQKLKKAQEERDAMAKHVRLVREQNYQRGLEDAQRQLESARMNMDIDAVASASENVAKIQSQLDAERNARLQQIDQEFLERNKDWWNEGNLAVVNRAKAMAEALASTGTPIEDIPGKVETAIRVELATTNPAYAGRATTPTGRMPSASGVSKTQVGNSNSANNTYEKLPADLKKVYLGVSKFDKGYTKDMFIQDLKKDGAI